MMPPKDKHAFSLVELMSVLALISILAALSMSATDSLKSANLSRAGNEIADFLRMGREHSLAKNCFVAIVIKTDGEGIYSAYRMFDLIRGENGEFSEWTSVTPWRFLPQGVVFSGEGVNNLIGISDDLPLALPTQCAFRGQNIDLNTAAKSLVFRPEGALNASGSGVRFRLVEGVSTPDGQVKLTRADTGGAKNFYDIFVIRDTGAAKIERP